MSTSSATELMCPFLDNVPPGYTMGELADGQLYLILQTFLNDLHQGLMAHRSKVDNEIASAELNVSSILFNQAMIHTLYDVGTNHIGIIIPVEMLIFSIGIGMLTF